MYLLRNVDTEQISVYPDLSQSLVTVTAMH